MVMIMVAVMVMIMVIVMVMVMFMVMVMVMVVIMVKVMVKVVVMDASHGTHHFIYTILLSSTMLYASIYGRVTWGSKPLKRSDLTYDMRRLNHSNGVI